MSIQDLSPDVLHLILSYVPPKTWIQTAKTCKILKYKIDLSADTSLIHLFRVHLPNFPKICYNPIWLNKFNKFKLGHPGFPDHHFTCHFNSRVDSFWSFQRHIRRLYWLLESIFQQEFELVNFLLTNYKNFLVCLQDLNHIFCCLSSKSSQYPNDKFCIFKQIHSKISTIVKLGNIMTKRRDIFQPLEYSEKHMYRGTIRSPRPIDTFDPITQRYIVLTELETYLSQATDKVFEVKDRHKRQSLVYFNMSHIIEHIFPNVTLEWPPHKPCFLCYHKCL